MLESLFGIHLQAISWVNLQTVAACFCLGWFSCSGFWGFLFICLIIGLELSEYIQEQSQVQLLTRQQLKSFTWEVGHTPVPRPTFAVCNLSCAILNSGFHLFSSASVAFYCRGNGERQCISHGETVRCP